MASTPLPDHWAALGVDRTADAATIKKTYRKLVLTCHPDKVTDGALKKQKEEEFHRIQQAYEILSDNDRRATYEAELKLEALRKEKLARTGGVSGSGAEAKSTRFDSRPPSGPYPANTSSQRYTTEERKPSRAYDDDRYFDGRRKYEDDDAYARPAPPPRSSRVEKEPSARTARPTTDRTRSDRNKTRERKHVAPESDSSADEKARHEAEWKRRTAEDAARRMAEEQRRAYDDAHYVSSSRKLSLQEEEALRYQHRARADVQADMRPSPVRTASRDYYNTPTPSAERTSSRREPHAARPEPVRRSSARPKERSAAPSSSSGRERERGGMPEIVEWDRRPPMFKHSTSSPADIQVPRSMPQRAYTTETPLPREYRRADVSPPPALHRSSTLPTVPSPSSSRRKEAATRPSGLRETMTPEHNNPERDHLSASSTKTKHHYYYPTPNGSVPLRADNLNPSTPHRTVLREPEHIRRRSPSPLSRPPIGANRQSHDSAYSTAGLPPPPMGRSSRNVSPVRGRPPPPLYGEINSDYHRRENTRARTSFSPHDMSYSRKPGPDDVRWAPREGAPRGERVYVGKPGLARAATFVC